MNDKILEWAVKIQSIAQAGLTYGHDSYDRERYEQLRHIAAEMVVERADIPVDTVKDLFCNESGYQTPKIDTRAAIFQGGKILLVHEILQRKKPQQNKSRCALTHITTKTGKRSSIKSEDLKT